MRESYNDLVSSIPFGKRIHAVFDGKNFIPTQEVGLRAGSEVILTVVEGQAVEPPEDKWSAFLGMRGIASAPASFKWDFDRGDLYRDVS